MMKIDPDVVAYLGKPRTRPRTALEAAIDGATGHVGDGRAGRRIIMKCRGCRRSRSVTMYECDPDDALILEWACPDCQKRDAKIDDTPRWFNALGAETKKGES